LKPDLEARMAQYEDGRIEFAILSLVKDPLIGLRTELALNVKSLSTVSTRLDELAPDWRTFSMFMSEEIGEFSDATLVGPSVDYSLSEADIFNATLPSDVGIKLAVDTVWDILRYRSALASVQARLRTSIREEEESHHRDEEKVRERRHDYGPAIQTWITFQARKGALRDILVLGKQENTGNGSFSGYSPEAEKRQWEQSSSFEESFDAEVQEQGLDKGDSEYKGD
jgi:ubiquitin carboxyl-terminal hydrolase L5